eukprot:1320737-Amorphochlora_amoeboformis.AAC.2
MTQVSRARNVSLLDRCNCIFRTTKLIVFVRAIPDSLPTQRVLRSSIIISSIKLETDLLFIDKTSYVRALWAYRKSDLGSSLLNVGGGGGRGGTGASS